MCHYFSKVLRVLQDGCFVTLSRSHHGPVGLLPQHPNRPEEEGPWSDAQGILGAQMHKCI